MKIRIRSVEPADAEVIQAIYAPFVSDTVISFETIVPDVAEIRSRIEAHAESCPWLVCEADQCVVGYAYASPHRTRPAYRWSVDVSVYVDPRHHRRGVGRALYTSLFDLLRRQGFLVCLSCESRARVDDLVKKAVAAGGRVSREPQDQGFMYGHGFEDPDGHIWELIYMDPSKNT
jgi:L-amino acid N-acyltransferase YncA